MAEVIEPVADRISNVRSFYNLIRPSIDVYCEPIEDPCGPSATMADLNVKWIVEIIEINIYFVDLVYYCH